MPQHLLCLSVIKYKQAAFVSLLSQNRGRPPCPTYIHSQFMWGVHYRECCFRAKDKEPKALCRAAFSNKKGEMNHFYFKKLPFNWSSCPSVTDHPSQQEEASSKYLTSSGGNYFMGAASKKTIKAHQCWQLHRLPEGCAAETKLQYLCVVAWINEMRLEFQIMLREIRRWGEEEWHGGGGEELYNLKWFDDGLKVISWEKA